MWTLRRGDTANVVENLEVLDEIIVGRTTPHIYAFVTNTVPNFLKVGDTYRSVERRLREWQLKYEGLREEFRHSASLTGDVYFRDYAVHDFLMRDRGRQRLDVSELGSGVYYSNEFFAAAEVSDVQAAIQDITRDHAERSGRYTFFDATLRLPLTHEYRRGAAWDARPNQQVAVDNFMRAVESGRTNLLMYAVMRYGKTFTSLLCAKEQGAKTVIVVSGKADVKAEWKKTVQSAGNFEGFAFLDSDALLDGPSAIQSARATHDCVVIFLTLQDLQGDEIKKKHSEVFSNEVDLLIIDETHFGARAEKYGEVLKAAKQFSERPESALGKERVDLEDAEEQMKIFDARVRLHLSGSPYRILMGSEFAPEDIVAFVQFADIVREQEQWDEEHPDEDEWNNPYFGFPQMVRFAFNPNESSRRKLEELRQSGTTYALSALFQPCSIARDPSRDLHKRFEHEAEVLDLLRAIDGTQQDPNVFGFLDYDKLKQGQMGRHIVMVLPYRASCDAMQALLVRYSDEFTNLGAYQIINISGVEDQRRYPTPESVKDAIARGDDEGQKTITLTVNRMLTGSTVEHWDTMIYLKDTASPQEYDQATFRLQSQFVRTVEAEDGQGVVRLNLKPQTLLVDFDPHRMFRMQEQRSLMSNMNTAHAGNAQLAERLREDLRISPIITVDSNQIREVEPANVLEAASEYNRARSIADEARDIPADMGLLANNDIRRVIELQAEIGNKAGLTLNAVEGDGEDLDFNVATIPGEGESSQRKPPVSPSDDFKSLERRIKTYYQRILFFAMLSRDPVASLEDVIAQAKLDDHTRLVTNLGLDVDLLQTMLATFDPFKLSRLDYKIQNISHLVRDEALDPIDRAVGALNKFTRLSDAEVRTPSTLCEKLVDNLPGDQLRAVVESGGKILDIGSKSGEFALALYDRLVNELQVEVADARSAIVSIPTSPIAYEFTRRFYEILGLDSAHVAQAFTAFDLLSAPIDLETVFGKGRSVMKFGAVVGNPPYQRNDGGGAGSSAMPLYQEFVEQAKALNPRLISMVVPSRWFTGGRGLDDFRQEMLSDTRLRSIDDYLASSDVFPEVGLKGGICYFLWDRDNRGDCRITTHHDGWEDSTATRPLLMPGADVFVRFNEGLSILQKVIEVESGQQGSLKLPADKQFMKLVSPRRPFGAVPKVPAKPARGNRQVTVFQAGESGSMKRADVQSGLDEIDKWKVFVGFLAPGTGNRDTYPTMVISTPFLGGPGSISAETYLRIGGSDSREQAVSIASYLACRLTRFLILLHKPSQNTTRRVYTFVPTQDWSKAWTDDTLYVKYGLTDDEIAFIEKVVRPMEVALT